MSVTVTEKEGGTIATDGTEQNINTAITTAGVFFLRLDLSVLQGGTTPDIIEVRETLKARTGGTARLLEGYPLTYVGGLAPAIIETPHRSIMSGATLQYTIKRVQGSDRTYTYAVLEVG